MIDSLHKLKVSRSLTATVVTHLLCVATIFQTTIGGIFYFWEKRFQHKSLEDLVIQISDQATRTLINPLETKDTLQIGRMVNNFSLIPSVYRISISDENNRVIYSKTHNELGGANEIIKAPRGEITRKELLLGWVEVELSTARVNAELRRYLMSIIGILLVSTCLQVVVLLLLLRKSIISPIKSIENYTAAVSSESLVLPEKPAGIFVGELASLRRSIVDMVTALFESERGYRSIYENSQEGIFQASLEGTFIKANLAMASMFGYDSCESFRNAITDIGEQLYLHSNEQLKIIDLLKNEGQVIRREVAFRHKDGHTIHCLLSIFAVWNEYGGIEHLEGSLIDISERKQAEEQLAILNQNLELRINERTAELHKRNGELIASEERYRTLVETIQEGILVVDREGRLTYINRQMSTMLGFVPEDLLGKSIGNFIEPSSRDSLARRLKIPSGKIAERFEMTFIRSDRNSVLTLVSPTSLYDPDGKYRGSFAVVTDITVLKHLQTRLLHSEKLESMGRLAAGIAHEINTPTQYIGSNFQFLEDSFTDITEILVRYESLLTALNKKEPVTAQIKGIEELRERLQIDSLLDDIPAAFHDIAEGLKRITDIVSSVKRFAHPGKDSTAYTDLNEAILSTITVSTNEWKYVADVETDFDPDLPKVPCVASAINQVILNLIVNAAHTIADLTENGAQRKGKITITTRTLGDFVEIRVSDTGKGIPEEFRNRIFDPFFTTKDVGKGTGQGLAIARTIITETHHGSIEFETDLGRGTTFIIKLPLAAPATA